jgi:hypothetical protein
VRGQTYKFGWLTAIGFLYGASDPDQFATNGAVLGAVFAVAQMVVGLAAAAVRAWSWFVLLAFQALMLVYGGYYVTFIAHTPTDRTIVAVTALTLPALQFAYFYKRRAMFGATWRWQLLERWLPALVGPETRDPGRVPGFVGLSRNRRLAFVIVVLVGFVLGLAAWVTPKGSDPVEQDSEPERQVTLVRP